MFDYPSLSALAAVVREGSFERAARALHVTPSAVSQRIRLLEERAGCALVVRGQPCRPTATGQQLIQHLERVRLLEHELHISLPRPSAVEGAQRVVLPVAVNADSLATWAADALAAFAASQPVLLDVALDDQDHTADWLREGRVLAAVTSMSRPVAGCNLLPLGAMRYVAAASPSFVRRHFRRGIDARALAQAPCLVFNQKDRLQDLWVSQCMPEAPVMPRHLLPSSQAFVTAALAGMGWGMQPVSLIDEHLRAGSLVQLQPDTPLDVPLFWQHSRVASTLLDRLTRSILRAARRALSMG